MLDALGSKRQTMLRTWRLRMKHVTFKSYYPIIKHQLLLSNYCCCIRFKDIPRHNIPVGWKVHQTGRHPLFGQIWVFSYQRVTNKATKCVSLSHTDRMMKQNPTCGHMLNPRWTLVTHSWTPEFIFMPLTPPSPYYIE